jgi:hypothetical protein
LGRVAGSIAGIVVAGVVAPGVVERVVAVIGRSYAASRRCGDYL